MTVCQRENCGHSWSVHRYEWDRFRGCRDTSCRERVWGEGGYDRCRCGAFLESDEGKTGRHVPCKGSNA